jgi:streptogramin lyase
VEVLENRIAPAVSITEFTTGLTANAQPANITAGPDGNLWFAEFSNPGRIGRITPAGVITEFSAGLTANSGPDGITAGPDGNLWFTEFNNPGRIGRITPAGIVTEFSAGLTAGSGPLGITAGPDGNLWFTEFNNPGRIGRITPAGVVTEFSAGLTANSGPGNITAGPDGNLWFTEFSNPGRIGRITPTGAITEFSAGLTANSQPTGITAGPDGNLWFTELGRIGRITPAGVITEFSAGLTANSGPFGITAGPDGNLWFTEFNNPGRIGQITRAGVITEFSAGLTANSGPNGITAGPDGNLWFTEENNPARIGQVTGAAISTTTMLATSGTPSVFGQSVTFTATVSASNTTVTAKPTGTVTFLDGNTTLGMSNVVNGVATFSTTNLAIGSHSITAVYNPTGTFTTSTSMAAMQVVSPAPAQFFAVGADQGGGSQVVVYNATTGAVVSSFFAFAPAFTGGVRVTVADINGDGTADIICAAGPTGGPQVEVIDGTKLNQVQANGQIAPSALLASFFAFAPTFTGGVYVAAAVSASGQPEVVVGAGATGGPQVEVLDGTKLTQTQSNGQIAPSAVLASFFAFAPTFTGGVRVAIADVNGDGTLDIICGAGPGGGPQVIVIDGTKLGQVQSNGQIAASALLASFFAFAPSFTGGVFVTAGATNGSQVNLIVSADAGGGPQVEVISGTLLASLQSNGQIANSALLANFLALPASFTGGVRVGFNSAFGSKGKPAILTAAGPGASPEVNVFDPFSFQSLSAFFALPVGFTGGVNSSV